MIEHRIGPLEAVGLRPLGRGLRQCAKAIVGDPYSPPAQWGLSSLKIFRPLLGPATWAGWSERRIPIMNFFNREMASRVDGYDVRVTFARDFRGRQTTYNSHMGTDFVVPVGTEVVAPAPGVVTRVENLMYRGGLKIVIDHGEGLVSLCGHLARALVTPGTRVRRGERIGLSGFSAVDGILFFPWVPPHVHMTVLLDGEPVDPFAVGDETALWRDGNAPRCAPDEPGAPFLEDPCNDDRWNAAAIDEMLASCRDPALRDAITSMPLRDRGHELVYWRLFAYESFGTHPPLYADSHPRRPVLDLPFRPRDFDGLALD